MSDQTRGRDINEHESREESHLREMLTLRFEINMLADKLNENTLKLNSHLTECNTRYKESARKAEEKREEDIRLFKRTLAAILVPAILGLLGLLLVGIKVWAKSP